MLKGFKEIVSEVAEPLSQGEKNFKDLHVKADNRDLVPGVTDQDFLFKGNPRRMDPPTASYEKEEDDDQSVKVYDKTLKREEVEQVDELSKKTLGSYVKKATDDVSVNSYIAGSLMKPKALPYDKKAFSRQKGIEKAVDKMTKEDVEQNNAKYGTAEKSNDIYHVETKAHGYSGSHSVRASSHEDALKIARKKVSHVDGDKVTYKIMHHDSGKEKTFTEEVKLDEISKKTLAGYIGAASADKSSAAHDIGRINQKAATFGTSASDRKERDALNKTHAKRSVGIQRAANKLAKEEVEQIDEISKDTKDRYLKRSMDSFQNAWAQRRNAQSTGDKETEDKMRKVMQKRNKGMVRVYGEDVESVEEMHSALTPHDHAEAQKMTPAEIKAKHKKYLDTADHHSKRMKDMSLTSNQRMASSTVATAAKMAAIEWKKKYMKEESGLDEKTLTSAEMKKREEVVKAIKRENPKMDKSMAYAIATKTAKRVAEGTDTFAIANKEYNSKDYKVKNAKYATTRTSEVDKMIKHDCAKHVAHEEWGVGTCIPEAHTIVETAEGEGYVTHYDIVFDHGIEFNVSVESLQVLVSESHEHGRRNMKEDIDYDYEGEMAKAELYAICDKAKALADMMEDDMQLEAWLQSKITKAKYMIDAVYDYLMYSNRNQAGTGPTPSVVSPTLGYNQSAAMTDTYGSFLNRMGESVDQMEAMSPEKKRDFAALAHPTDKITYADKIVGAKLQAAKEKAGKKNNNSDVKSSDMDRDVNEKTTSVTLSREESELISKIMKED